MGAFKILQVGLGSMGKRRIRNLQYLGYNDIKAWDIREDRRIQAKNLYNIVTLDSREDINWGDYTHLIISTPPDQHIGYALDGVKNGLHVFIEASVVNDGMDELIELKKEKPHTVLAPSCTMRFDPIMIKAKEVIESGDVGDILYVNHYFGQYLPDWHPYEDIRDFYVSNKATGAAREIIPFDLVYLTWLFGDVVEVTGMLKKSKSLGEDIEIDDIYTMISTTDKGALMQVAIDVVSRVGYRDTRAIGTKGNLEIDYMKGQLGVYDGINKKWSYYKRNSLANTYSREEMYVREMDCFVKATKGEVNYPYTIEEDEHVLNMLYKVEKSFYDSKFQKL